jgi:hypothetical protein
MIIYDRLNEFYRAYSDKGYYIEKDSNLYEEAIDIEFTEYNETNVLIPISEAHSSEYDEIIEGE